MTAGQISDANQASAYSDVDKAISANTPRNTVLGNIMNNAAGYSANGLSYEAILKYANAKYAAYDASVENGDISTATAPSTSSVFKNW